MSNRYKGAVISATPPTTTGGEDGVASGAWTLEQQMQLQAAGLWPAQPTGPYIEQVFSTYLYTGNETARSITNGINLSGKGGMLWIKDRSNAIRHTVFDSARAAVNYFLIPNSTAAQNVDFTNNVTSFNANGFSLGTGSNENGTGRNYVSWTFRNQAKFFDVQTFTYPLSGSITVPHNLASTPGCVMVKVTDGVDNWYVYHRMANNGTNPSNYILQLNTTSAQINNFASWITVGSSSITFPSGALNPGSNFVMYLFAHDAGGFGLTGTDNVISCGSVAVTGSAQSVSLGYEPQWILWKKSSGSDSWWMFDTMRGLVVDNASGTGDKYLYANSSAAEAGTYGIDPTATGFNLAAGWGAGDYIYIAIRRGPMKVPTSGTSVFSPSISSSTTANITSGFVTDLAFTFDRTGAGFGFGQNIYTRLQGNFVSLNTTTTNTEDSNSSTVSFGQNNGIKLNGGTVYSTGYVYEQFQRAPSFCDVVCYTGTGAAMTVAHNLTVAPELIILKSRNNAESWMVYAAPLGNNRWLALNSSFESDSAGLRWNDTTPTSSVFSVGKFSGTTPWSSGSGYTYVAYLFATCAGVSKVGSYTGTGAAQTINCGFTSGARFVLIKRTDSTGDWYFWDSARGIIPSNDPYLLVNSAVAEVTGTDYVDTTNVGFDITSTAPAAINASAGTYIFLAIA
jgi:hypothetical protein